VLDADAQRSPRKLGRDVALLAQRRQPLPKRMHIDPGLRRNSGQAPNERSGSTVSVQEKEEVEINTAPHPFVMGGLRIHNQPPPQRRPPVFSLGRRAKAGRLRE
jgi:hypothetical protein